MENLNNIVGKIVEGYKILKILGKGKFSTVYQAERQKDHKLVALKIIKIYDMMDKNAIDKCLQEVNLLQKVSHPNIVKYLDSFISQNELYIAIEWADKGDVKRLIRKYKQEGDFFDEARVLEYTRELASALHHMHEKRVIHRDLKPANILIFSDGTFKLGDLGLGRFMSDETFKAFSKVGTPLYMAPEVINNIGYDFKSDNWSLGCVVYELITLKSPFQADEKISMMELFKKINTGKYRHIKDQKYSISSKIVDELLKVNPEERIELTDVIKKCEDFLALQEEKPRIDPFIVMDDIIEKLRLIDYENNFCVKYNKEIITKYYFACSIYGYNYNESENVNKEGQYIQFAYFYDLSHWLMLIINKNTPLTLLGETDIKFKQYDKKKSHDSQLNELINNLKNMDVKIIQNSRFKYGYGEGVCLSLTQLCDQYLIKQNFIFNRPKFKEHSVPREIESKNDYDRIMLEENIGTNIGFKANTNYNFGNNFKGPGSGNGNKFFIGNTKKRFNSANSNNDDATTIVTSDISSTEGETEFKPLPSTVILHSSIEPNEWKKEFLRVENLLKIPEVPEILESQSEGDINYNTTQNMSSSSNFNSELKVVKKIGCTMAYCNNLSPFFDQVNQYCEGIDNELNKISITEKILSNSKGIKESLLKLRLNRQSEIDNNLVIEGKKMEIDEIIKQKEVIEEKIKKLSQKRDDLIESKDKDEVKTMKKTIDKLKREIKKFDTEIDIYNSLTFNNKYKNLFASEHNRKYNNIDIDNSEEYEKESPLFDNVE